MKYKVSKTQLNYFSLFSLGSEDFGYGHYKRIKNLISILKNKKRKFIHYSYGEKIKKKIFFLDRLDFEVKLGRNIILDITNDLFLDKNTISIIKKIFTKKELGKIFIIDAPTKKNLSTILDLEHIKTLVPFQITEDVKKKLLKIKNKKFGIEYFIYSNSNLKRQKKIYDIALSFGGSDNYKGTLHVLKLLDAIKVKKKILVVNGKYFKESYKKKIFSICKKNKFEVISFSKNFSSILNKSKLLITNSGLTKYEGIIHGLKIIVFSDTKESQKIDEFFLRKTKQYCFPYLKNFKNDKLKLNKILKRQLRYKKLDKNNLSSNINNIINFFEND